ncbi:MAG: hypothetical protein GXO39_04360 [Thermotogae bacterium]|nr:hypothetical protein [Thermotogota bacterium]
MPFGFGKKTNDGIVERWFGISVFLDLILVYHGVQDEMFNTPQRKYFRFITYSVIWSGKETTHYGEGIDYAGNKVRVVAHVTPRKWQFKLFNLLPIKTVRGKLVYAEYDPYVVNKRGDKVISSCAQVRGSKPWQAGLKDELACFKETDPVSGAG